jgi:SpoVK/Ycf46/Vps4 family AAA+-type ATPase
VDKNTEETKRAIENSVKSIEETQKVIEEAKNMINLLKNTEKNFNYNLNNFMVTGENEKDTLLLNTVINDPNIYNDFFLEKPFSFKRIPSSTNDIEPKKMIYIEAEINNISDILLLVEKYKLVPNIDYNINMNALHNIKKYLEKLNNMIGMKDIKNNIVEQILYFIQNLHKNKNKNGDGDFMHTVIYGPPGTGKTEIAKIMGKIFSKLGVLDKDKFLKVTRSDLIAGYLGQTALKTKDVIKEALGGVLFIDEAYSLGNTEKKDSFSKECIDTLCEALSDYKDNLMVIIAGYENELKECFFDYNQGLESRFTWRFKMNEYTGEDLYQIFLKKVADNGWCISENTEIKSDLFKENLDSFKFFGRDIEALLTKTKIAHSKRVFCKPVEDKKKLILKDLETGFQMYLNNSEIKKRKEAEYLKKQLYNSIYC